MNILHPQPPELCARCGEEVKDLEWIIEQPDGRVIHEEWSMSVCKANLKTKQLELAL